MSDEENEYGWAKELVEQGAWVLQIERQYVGKVTKFYDGVEATFISSINNLPVKGPVLELDLQHQFLAKKQNFIPLAEKEVSFYVTAQEELNRWLQVATTSGATLKVQPMTIGILVLSVLKTQAMALEASMRQARGAIPDDVVG